MDNHKSLGRYLVEKVGGELEDDDDMNGQRYEVVLGNFLEGWCEKLGDVVRGFYVPQGFISLSSSGPMDFNFSKPGGIVKSVILTYENMEESLRVRCDSFGFIESKIL
ncbi:hypothetical protein HOE04_03870 [archaeon]|jgi:hypothetical protein|nr:hypothetical protein [archaeon]